MAGRPKKHESDAAGRSARRASARDISRHGPPKNAARKKRGRLDLLRFLRDYLIDWYPLPFSPDHLRVIGLLQTTILAGGLQAVAMPRGSGKTTIFKGALVWAQAYGHRRFVLVVAADAKKAEKLVSSLKAAWSHNANLADDFPEACKYIRALGGISRRAEGQTSDGEETMLVWTKDELRLPKFAAGGGSVVRSSGITGAIRGAVADLANGTQVRPDLVLIDDPQTRESALSVSQTDDRLGTIQGDIMGLAGPGESLACLCAVTVINRGDLADQLLDRSTHPEWQGLKFGLMHAMPTNVALWDQYAEILREDLRTEKGGGRATEFYRDNRAKMDAGADAAWPERKKKDELSAVQHAMNLRITTSEAAFMAEYQNTPTDPLASAEVEQLTAQVVLRKCNNMDRGMIPIESTTLTAGIDVQYAALYWGMASWTPGFSGDLIGYGTYPDQGRPYFTLQEIEKTMIKTHPGASWEASLYAALEALVEYLAGREWMRDDGGVQRVDQIIIDAGYGDSTPTIRQFCRRSKYSSILLPFFGRTVHAGAASMDEWKKKPGDRIGQGWRIARPTTQQTKHVLADVNKWKSVIADRFLTPFGSAGCLSVYGKPADHRMLADQVGAERRTRVAANGRTSDEWRPLPNRDNHFLDTLVMAAVGASIRGVKLDDQAIIRMARPDAAAAPNTTQAPAQPAPAPTNRPGPRRPRGGGFLSGYGFGGGR